MSKRLRFAPEHRSLARAYRDMAKVLRDVLGDPIAAERCIVDAEHHEREAEREEALARATPGTRPRAA